MDKPVLEAVTVYRPWAWAIAYLGKDIENRGKRLQKKPGTWIAIHAGKTWDQDGADFIERINPRAEALIPMPPEEEQPTGIIALARFAENVTKSDSEWFFGPIGWRFDDAFALIVPIPCRGFQGLWAVPNEHLPRLRDEYRGYQGRSAS